MFFGLLFMVHAAMAQVRPGASWIITLHSSVQACDTYTLEATGETFTRDTTVEYTQGDTVYILQIEINPSYVMPTEHVDAECWYQWGRRSDTIYDNLVHYDTLHTLHGYCDSIVSIQVNMSFHHDTDITALVCTEYVAPWSAQPYTASGVYTHSDTSSTGCISTTTLTLTVAPSFVEEHDTVVTICPNTTSYMWTPYDGQTRYLSNAGTYLDSTINTLTGCKVRYTLNLARGDSLVVWHRPRRCEYDSIKIGTSRYSFRIENGDTVIRKFTGSSSNPTVTIVEPDEIFSYNLAKQCTTYYDVRLNIMQPSDTNFYDTATVCDSYNWRRGGSNMMFYESIDTTIITYLRPANITYIGSIPHRVHDCVDRNNHLALTVHHSDTTEGETTVEACEMYRGYDYTEYHTEGHYIVQTDTTGQGCPLYSRIDLVIHRGDTMTSAVEACGYYRYRLFPPYYGYWYFTQSGQYTVKTDALDGNGCQRYWTIDLTVHPYDTLPGVYDTAVCDYLRVYYDYDHDYMSLYPNTSWKLIGEQRAYIDETNDGTYTIPTEATDANGCHLYKNINLTVRHGGWLPDTIVTADVCEYNAYDYLLDSMVTLHNYPEGNVYIVPSPLVDTNGCHMQQRVMLNINRTYEEKKMVWQMAEREFVWHDSLYSTPGIHEWFWRGTTAQGCDSIVHEYLYLTLTNPEHVGITEIGSSDRISLYPNPTNGYLHVDAPGVRFVEVYDLYGRRMLETCGNTMDFSALPSGAYMVRVIHDDGIVVKQVIRY